jgi:hypothetical protein
MTAREIIMTTDDRMGYVALCSSPNMKEIDSLRHMVRKNIRTTIRI